MIWQRMLMQTPTQQKYFFLALPHFLVVSVITNCDDRPDRTVLLAFFLTDTSGSDAFYVFICLRLI